MPLVTDYQAVKDIYRQAAELGVGLPMFCAEDRETLEAILAAALKMGREIGVDDLPITPAWTCRYPHRPQMTLVSACGNPALGTRLMLSDLERFMDDCSPYRKLRVMPHFDHAIPWLDADILDALTPRFASVMFDASEKPFEENIRLTARYVEKFHGQVVVEAAVDEIFESGSDKPKNQPTTVEQAADFLRRTGVDIIVPNVGTEHRATADQVVYRGDQARRISAAVGKILCLHGTSSLKAEDLSRLPGDGFLKINVFTTLAVLGGQAVARNVLDNLGNIFSADQLQSLARQGVLGEKVLADDYAATEPPIRPKLAGVANPPRRDAWFAAVRDRCCDFLTALNYRRYQK
jgi:fructose/tagatose bisphosphate aldolase